MYCEYCGKKHNGEYGSGRFCSEKCARGFSTKYAREKINQKVSEKLKGRSHNYSIIRMEESKKRQSESLINTINSRYKSLPFEELSRRQQRKVVINEQNNKCNVCGNEFVWLNIPLVPHIHHKNGDRKDKSRKNVEALCPNCHSQTKNYGYKDVSNEIRQKHSNNIIIGMKHEK